MSINDIKQLQNGDILTSPKFDSHNNSVFVYRVLSSEKRNIGWVVSVILMYKFDVHSSKRTFMNKKLGFGLSDQELLVSSKRDNKFLREEIVGVFHGS